MTLSIHSPPRPREARIDSLRGLMLVDMAMNHIASPFSFATDHPFGYTSSAEGFVFLAGIVAGLVYGRRWQSLDRAAVVEDTRKRAVHIYLYHLALYVGLLLWIGIFFVLNDRFPGNTPSLIESRPGTALLAGAFLVHQPPLMDILPMYAGFMLLLPPILDSFIRGRCLGVLMLSCGTWILANLFLPQTSLISGVVQVGAFSPAAWQFLFIIGLAGGFSTLAGTVWRPRPFLVLLAVGICAYAFLVRHGHLAAPFQDFAWFVNKNNIAPFRLLNTLGLFYLVSLLARRWPRAFVWPPLALLGRHSLPVFSIHVAVAYAFFAFPQYVATSPARMWLGTAIMFAAMFLTAAVHAKWRQRPDTRAEHIPVQA